MEKSGWSARRLALAKRLLQPATTVLSSAVAIFTTLVLAASEQKYAGLTVLFAVDGAVAACCFLHTGLFALAGALESWDVLIMLVTVANFVIDFLYVSVPFDELSYVQALLARIGSAFAMVWVTEEVLLFRRYRLKEAVEQMESSAQSGVSEPSGKASTWGRGRGLLVSDMAALSPRSQAAAAGGMPSIAMLSRQASMSALPASARVRTEAFVPSMGSTIRRALQLLLRVSIGAIAIAQASNTFITRVSPLSATAQRLLFTCIAIILLVAVTQLTLRHTLHRKVVQPVVALASLIERLGALPLPPTEEEEGKLQNGDEEDGKGHGRDGSEGRAQGRASGINSGSGGDSGSGGGKKGSGLILRGSGSSKGGRAGSNPTRRSLRRSNSNTETFFDVVMATLPAKVSRRIRRLLTALCTCTRAKTALVNCKQSMRKSVTSCLRKMGYKVKRRKASMAPAMSLIASDNTYRVRETEVLRAYVRRMWKLVRLGFGEAGQRLVSTAIDLEGEWKDAAAGTKVDAVFGFCDVRSFTDLTECLQAEVLPFVNDLARVVHGDVHASGGAPNKNIGDAFLLVWKLPATPLQNNTAAVLNQQRAKAAAVAESVGLMLTGGAGAGGAAGGGGGLNEGKGLMPTASKRGSVVDWLKHNMLGVAGAGTTGATTATVPVTAVSAGETGSTPGPGSGLDMTVSGPPSAGGTTTGPDGQPVKVNSKKSFSSSLKGLFRRGSGNTASASAVQGNSRGSVPSVSSQKGLGPGTSVTGSRNSAGSLPEGAQRKASVPDMPDLRDAQRAAPPILAKYASVGSTAWPGSPGSPEHHGIVAAPSSGQGAAETVIVVQDGGRSSSSSSGSRAGLPPTAVGPGSRSPAETQGARSGASSSRQQSEGHIQVIEDKAGSSLSPATSHTRAAFSPMIIPLASTPLPGSASQPTFTVPGTVSSVDKETPMLALSSVGSAASASSRPALDLPDLDTPKPVPPTGKMTALSPSSSGSDSLLNQAIGYSENLDRSGAEEEKTKGGSREGEVDVPLLVQPYMAGSEGNGRGRSSSAVPVPNRAAYRPSMEPVPEVHGDKGGGLSSASAEEDGETVPAQAAGSTSTSAATGGVGIDEGGIVFVKIQGDKAVKSPALVPPGTVLNEAGWAPLAVANRRQSFTQQLGEAMVPPLIASPPVYKSAAQATGNVYVVPSPPAGDPCAGQGGEGQGQGQPGRTGSTRIVHNSIRSVPGSINISRAALAEEVASRRRNTMNMSIPGLPSSAFLSPGMGGAMGMGMAGAGGGALMHLPPQYPQQQQMSNRRRSGSAPGASPGAVAPLYSALAAPPQGRVSSARSLQMEHGLPLADGVDTTTATALSAPRADGTSAPTEYRQLAGVSLLATNALAAFLNIIIKIHAANMPGGALFTYRMHPRVKASHLWTNDSHEELDPFRIRAGFGLHIGWAVEGAIGSSIKVDASYLSPSVNVTARLESATRFYGVDLLISKAFAQCLSYDVVGLLRRIDRVKLKGVAEPTDLYTFDWDPRAGLELLVGKQAARALEREDMRQAMGLGAGVAPSSAVPTTTNQGQLSARSPAFLKSAGKSASFASPTGFGNPPVLFTGPSLNMADLTPAPKMPPSNNKGGGRRSSAAHPFARPVAMLMHSASLTSVKEFAPGGLQDLGGGDAGSAIYGQEGLVTAAGPLPGPLGSWIARQPTLGGPAMREASSLPAHGGRGEGHDKMGWLKKVVGQSRRWLGVPLPEEEDGLHSPGVTGGGMRGGLEGTPFSTPGLLLGAGGQDWVSTRPGAHPVALGRAGGRKAGIRYVPPNAPGSGQEAGQLPVLGLGAMGLYGSAGDQAADLRLLQRDAGDEEDETQMSPMTAMGRSWLSIPPKEGMQLHEHAASSAESEGGAGGGGPGKGGDTYGASQGEEFISARGNNGAPTPSGTHVFGNSPPPRRAFHPTFLSLSDMAVDAYLGEYVTGCRCDAPPLATGASEASESAPPSARDGQQAGDSVAVSVGGETGMGPPTKRTTSRRRSSWGDEAGHAMGTHTHTTRAADWGLARECALKALALHPYDGPLKAMLKVIESQGVLDAVTGRMAAPPTWQGYRLLDSK